MLLSLCLEYMRNTTTIMQMEVQVHHIVLNAGLLSWSPPGGGGSSSIQEIRMFLLSTLIAVEFSRGMLDLMVTHRLGCRK